MRVLVTGGCGFLGSHVCEQFLERGWEVVSYDNMTKLELARTGYQTEESRDHNWKLLEGLGTKMVRADVRDLDELLDQSSGCDFVVHTAAQPAVTISLDEPLLDMTTNVVGTVNVLESARRHGVPIASCATVHVYGNQINDSLVEAETRFTRDPVAIDESASTMTGFLSPLHASKASADHYVNAYAQAYDMRAASFRLTGLYGPRQLGGEDHGWVANFVIRNLLRWPITLFGTGKQLRDILFATDAAAAFYAFYENGEAGAYNIGGGPPNMISLIEALQLIEELTGRPNDVGYEPVRFGDLSYFVCDTTRASNVFGWQSTIRPKDGISRLIEWVESNRQLFDGSAMETK